MKVKTVTLSFPPSGSPDVSGYRLYMEEAPNAVGYDSPSWDLGNVTSIDLSTLDGMTTRDGIYNIGITAKDSAGNESSMSKMEGVTFDLVAPDPPGQIVIERS
ncbi:hypothetical protein [uncultured Desulfosarcina sp.]|uniref:hypothetical protein n=1 Tax=uncultured Desulfosarcina sp. TaxID=218289 RepID=UPI0029C9A945|nr:hypothetical protein [uncultured Desulfosarcina sp.]